MRQGRQRPHADERRSSQMPLIWTGHTLEHPGRNLQPAIRLQSAQRAAENISVRLADSLMDGHAQRRPGMPRVQKLPENGPVGVLKPCSTMRFAHTARSATGHRSHCKMPMTHPARHRENRPETLPSAAPKIGCRAGEGQSLRDPFGQTRAALQ
jgi:hypothetical protein